jgi:hypothetical protein
MRIARDCYQHLELTTMDVIGKLAAFEEHGNLTDISCLTYKPLASVAPRTGAPSLSCDSRIWTIRDSVMVNGKSGLGPPQRHRFWQTILIDTRACDAVQAPAVVSGSVRPTSGRYRVATIPRMRKSITRSAPTRTTTQRNRPLADPTPAPPSSSTSLGT